MKRTSNKALKLKQLKYFQGINLIFSAIWVVGRMYQIDVADFILTIQQGPVEWRALIIREVSVTELISMFFSHCNLNL